MVLPSVVGVGPVVTAGPFTVAEIGYEPGYRQAPHQHEAASVTIVLRGMIRETAVSVEETGSALSVAVKPPGVRHADQVGPDGAHTLQVVFEPSRVEAGDGAALPRDWRWLHAHPAAAAMLAVLRRARTRDPCALEDEIFDALSALPDQAPTGREPPGWVRRAREALDDQLPAGPSVAELARALGAHPFSLSRAFRRHYGITISAYRRRQRLRRAADAVAGSDRGLSLIAHDAGYADHPQLSRDFRRTAGVSPSRYRGLVRAG